MKSKIKFKNTSNKKTSAKWIITIVIWTFILSVVINSVSSGIMPSLSIELATIILILLILLGIIFDIIGVAVATATDISFHSMCSKNVNGAKESLSLIKHSEKVASFCNDVVGDIAGIISGAAATIIITKIANSQNQIQNTAITLIITALVASLTVGGKALGKAIAMRRANAIVYRVGIIIFYLRIPFSKIKRGK